MSQIKTIVMLMLENRSLDTMLGWLYHNGAPAVVSPPGSSPRFDGIPSDAVNHYKGGTFTPAQGTAAFREPCRIPSFDPNEPMEDVKYQLYADEEGRLPGEASGRLPDVSFWEQEPLMSGFVGNCPPEFANLRGQILGAYSAHELPVMYGLAENFAVSDRWFSSAPTQTFPNRAFAICGTSGGAEYNKEITADDTFAATDTVFNLLAAAGKTWGFYWQMANPLSTLEPVYQWEPLTSHWFPRMKAAPNGRIQKWQAFLDAAKAGELPEFCFLEPYWGGGMALNDRDWIGYQGNDYHPPAWVGPAEADLDALYNALVDSPQWSNMLLIITFDEHGGSWDHVPPPKTVAPDENVGKSGFPFDRLGVRVPTILVSPFIQKGTVFRAPEGSAHDFDHTSFIATLLKWAGVDPSSAGMGARVAVAPTFEGVLSNVARTDKPRFEVPEGYAKQGGGVGAVTVNDLGFRPMNVHAFREAVDAAEEATELYERLQALTHTSR